MSPILVKFTSRSDSNFERSNISLKEDKRDGVDSNSNGFGYCVRKNEGKILWFSADCIIQVILGRKLMKKLTVNDEKIFRVYKAFDRRK